MAIDNNQEWPQYVPAAGGLGFPNAPLLPAAIEQVANKNQANGYAGLNGTGDLVGTVLVRQDTAANLATLVPESGQICYATDTKKLSIGDAATTFANLLNLSPARFNVVGTGTTVTLPPSTADDCFYLVNGTVSQIKLPLPDHVGQRVLIVLNNTGWGLNSPFDLYIYDGTHTSNAGFSAYSGYSGAHVLIEYIVMVGSGSGATARILSTSLTTTEQVAWRNS